MKKGKLILFALIMILNLVSCGQTKTVEVIKCTNCGAINAASANFCANCGSTFVQKDTEGTHSTPVLDNNSGVMQNSGTDCIYYGNNVCVDGDIIYIGYYGQLFVFCGDEVAAYANGGSTANAMAEMYLYNGYVYYANLGNDSIYRMNVADGEREIVLSGIGEIDDTFMRGDKLYIDHIVDGENDAISVLDLNSHESELLFCENETVKWMFYNSVDKNLFIISEELDDLDRYSILDAKNATVHELFSIDSVDEWECRYSFQSDNEYVYFDIFSYNTNDEKIDDCYRVRIDDYTVEKIGIEVYDAATHISFDDKLEWEYYLAWGSHNLCREHKETKVQEVLVKSGSGNRDYAIREILYADDTRIIFERERMADGAEFSIWVVDSDGNHLSELIRNPYYGDTEIFPIGTSTGGNANGSVSGGGSSSGDNGDAVGTKTCALCGGDGRITCYYCKGSGKGQTIYVMGIPTEQGCSYCGSSGWRLCSGCGGKGVK